MKKVVAEFIRTFGCETGYSGNTRTLYIKGVRASEARQVVRSKWPTLAFALKITDEIPEEAKEEVPQGNLQVFSGSTVDEALATSVIDKAMETVFGPEAEAPAKSGSALLLREKIDEYLLANPIDRHAKNPYLAVADLFKVKNDYIRGRWRALREKGLVEKELSNQNA